MNIKRVLELLASMAMARGWREKDKSDSFEVVQFRLAERLGDGFGGRVRLITKKQRLDSTSPLSGTRKRIVLIVTMRLIISL